MLFFCFGEDQDVVQVDDTKVVNQSSKGLVDVALKCSGCISEPKDITIYSRCPECCFPDWILIFL
jgi:hypothetical protein